ncbi:helix-turn-helix domain-containing protein [Vallitalea okinawensis]|uniref:helix-turn-helix domain-containing protein n=1 Tax=Vallitalea okinawensis TaxID=2078660 RepID=UPI001300A0F0|nr:helix-turn-helix domain-containing protein [Vallitalea okinawensis]
MNPEILGNTIRFFREKKGFTQKELAKDICSPQYIYLIETGKRIPSSYILEQLSTKLGGDIRQYLNLSEYSDPLKLLRVQEEITFLRENHDFQGLYEKLLTVNNEDLQNNKIKQFYLWNKAICINELFSDIDETFTLLEEALAQTKEFNCIEELLDEFLSKEELHILNSITKLYADLGNYKCAIRINKHLLDKVSTTYLDFYTSKVYHILLYNLAKYLSKDNQYEEAIMYMDQFIEIAIKCKSIYLLAEALYQKGIDLYHLNQTIEAKKYIKHAISLFQVQGRQDWLDEIQAALKEKYYIK